MSQIDKILNEISPLDLAKTEAKMMIAAKIDDALLYNKKRKYLSEWIFGILEFLSEFVNKKYLFSKVSIFRLIVLFIKGYKKLLDINLNKISVEITNAKSIFLFTSLENYNIYFEIFFDEAGKYITTSVNVYENKSQILSLTGSFEKISKEIEDAIKNYKNDIFSKKKLSGTYNFTIEELVEIETILNIKLLNI